MLHGITEIHASQKQINSIAILDEPDFCKVDTTDRNGLPTDASTGLW